MVMVGVDVHKQTHTAVMVDELGRRIGECTVRATDAGHQQLVRWAMRGAGGQEVIFAVEDCRHVSVRLERALLGARMPVVRVPPKMMAGARSAARTRGKSDPIDALAIARAALREPNLPLAQHDDGSHELKLLVDHREDLVNQRTSLQNRLRWHLHALDPELDVPARRLDSAKLLAQLAQWLQQQPKTLTVRIASELLADICELTRREKAIEGELKPMVEQYCPQLLELQGCGVLTAAKIIGETANISRFRSAACYAMHAGVAPIPASSGKTNRHRLARGGNRQLNTAFHRIAVTQIAHPGQGQDYYRRRLTMNNTKMHALRALKRQIARAVYRTLHTPTQRMTRASQPAAA